MLRELVEGGAEGLVWVEDTATCEGRSLLRAFVTAAVKRAEPVDVVLLEVTREQFGVGLSPDVKKQLRFHDDGADPRGWLGGDGGRAALWGCNGAGPNSMVVLDSLSAALLRERPHVAGRKLRAAMGAGRGEQSCCGGTPSPPPPKTPRTPTTTWTCEGVTVGPPVMGAVMVGPTGAFGPH
eukprot:XP_015129621.1 elongator complex protein 5 isoform X3 [Gallus gallus]